MDMEPKMFRGQESSGSTSCQMVERITDEKINGLKDRVAGTEHDIRELQEGIDCHINEVRDEVRKGYADLSKQLTEHEKKDDTNIMTIHTQLMQRIPAWVMTILMTAASIIGAMGMWILDHLKH